MAADGDAEPVRGMVVFQCANCRTIIGDSGAWACASEALRAVTLSAASSVSVERTLQLSQEGGDEGCTFCVIKCSCCKQQVGKQYRSTTPALDAHRGLFTFTSDSIISYELCTPAAPGLGGGGATAGVLPSELLDRIESTAEAVTKIQQLMLVFNERLRQLEDAARRSSPPAALEAPSQPYSASSTKRGKRAL